MNLLFNLLIIYYLLTQDYSATECRNFIDRGWNLL